MDWLSVLHHAGRHERPHVLADIYEHHAGLVRETVQKHAYSEADRADGEQGAWVRFFELAEGGELPAADEGGVVLQALLRRLAATAARKVRYHRRREIPCWSADVSVPPEYRLSAIVSVVATASPLCVWLRIAGHPLQHIEQRHAHAARDLQHRLDVHRARMGPCCPLPSKVPYKLSAQIKLGRRILCESVEAVSCPPEMRPFEAVPLVRQRGPDPRSKLPGFVRRLGWVP